MTLVIAKISGSNIFIESDSRITDEKLVKTDPLCGLLKTLILNPFVCLSFAGNIYYAEKALQLFKKQQVGNINDLLAMLLSVHHESENQTDFAVATIVDKIPRLFKISDWQVEKDISNLWLGDYEGFELYQSEYHKLEETIPVEQRMRHAFGKVVDSSDIKTIGDFHISTELDYEINSSHPVFLHLLKLQLEVTEKQMIAFDNPCEFKPFPLGTTEGGSHGISYLVTVSPNYHGVAIHFTHGNFGVIFCPQLGFKGTLIRNVSGMEFVEIVKKEYNIPLRGFVKQSDTSLQFIDNRDL